MTMLSIRMWRLLTAGIVLATLASTTLARAGDAPAHASAAAIAAFAVATDPEFVHGVGALPGCTTGFIIPSDDAFNDDAVNEPDAWLCFDSRQPIELSIANDDVVGINTSTLLTLIKNVSHCPVEMACNYTHFASNPIDPRVINAAAAQQIVLDDASLLLLDTPSDCNQATWTKYWRRVVNAIHYAQDSACVYHTTGNALCSSQDLIAQSAAVGSVYSFAAQTQCASWVNSTLAKAIGVSPTLACDNEVVGPLGLSANNWVLYDLCFYHNAIACMGEERLLRHHCAIDPIPNVSLTCAGSAPDLDCSVPNQYCEGEYCARGGQDYIGAAVSVSKPIMVAAARAWATACGPSSQICNGASGSSSSSASSGGAGAGGSMGTGGMASTGSTGGNMGAGGMATTGSTSGSTNSGANPDAGVSVPTQVFAHTSDTLYWYDPDKQQLHNVGVLQGCNTPVWDLALDKNSNMYAVTQSSFYSVDRTTAICTHIADSFVDYPNSLSFVPAGTADPNVEALVGYSGATYVRIDPATGALTTIGSLGNQDYWSSGDLVSVVNGGTYLSVQGGPQNCYDCIVKVDPKTGAMVSFTGALAYVQVDGLAYWGGSTYGFDNSGNIFRIDLNNGATTLIATAAVPWYGAGATTSAPTH